MWDKIKTLTIKEFEELSEQERKEIEEYKDIIIEEIDSNYSEEDKKREMEEETNIVNNFWKEDWEREVSNV
jgi:hypothetical protein